MNKKRSEATRKLWENPEYREHMRKVHSGKSPSKETRERMRSAMMKNKLWEKNIGRKQSEEEKQKRNKSRSWYKHSEETKKKISLSTKGRKWSGSIPPSKLGVKMSEETKKKISIANKKVWTPEKRIEAGKKMFGENGPNWQGGKVKANEKLRKCVQYKLWREAVFTRDNWTCVFCFTRGGKLNADHIKPFAHYPELRFAIDNGRTLCESCHRKTDTYGGRGGKQSLKDIK